MPTSNVVEPFTAFAVTAPGIAPLVVRELQALNIVPGDVSDAGVSFPATLGDLARANLWLRTATRVLVRLGAFEATDFATLERRAKLLPWSRVLRAGATVQLRVTCRKSRLYHSDAVAERVARAIEGKIAGSRVELRAADEEQETPVDSNGPQLVVVRFDHDACTISADSSGTLLHRRGWRQAVARAPLRETLASVLLAASAWDDSLPLVDPFAGSGTIGIEAALRARNLAPGLARPFAMERWPSTPAGLLPSLRRDAHRVARPRAGAPIVLADRDAGACTAARANAERAGVLDDVTILQRSVSETDLMALGAQGSVVTNPPYGVRVAPGHDLRALYQRFGDVMRAGGAGWHVTLLAYDRTLSAQMRLSLQTKLRTTNGGLPVTVEGN